MANIPYFVISPNAVMSFLGLLRGPDKTVPTPAEDWRNASVEVVIPALNEARNIILALASISKQTLKPKRIVLIDDGSKDQTVEYAKIFCEENHIDLLAIKRKEPIGKTPTLKRQSRESDADVIFVLDADTILHDVNYIERAVEELYKAIGIASACGVILPLRVKDRAREERLSQVQTILEKHPDLPRASKIGLKDKLLRTISNTYRDALYMFLQRFVYRGQMYFFGSIINPVGCAVAYRRKCLKDVFDTYEPQFGDDLTNSEDIFIGFALAHRGYRNIQLQDVSARSQEPTAGYLPKQIYLWSSSFLQSCYYFDFLVRSPFKLFKRRPSKKEREKNEERRKIQEPYRQTFGDDRTRTHGRPLGWSVFSSLFEKISFPAVLLVFAILGRWDVLLWTILLETIVACLILFLVAKGHRIQYVLKGVLITPLRYLSVFYDLFTLIRFTSDIWIFRSRKWRK